MTVIIVVVILAVAGIAAYVVLATPSSPSSTSSTTSSTTTSSSSSSTSASTAVNPGTLTIDEAFYPSYGMNVLLPGLTFPDYMYNTVFQSLLAFNVSAEYKNQGYQILPDLASNWTVSSDGLTYTLNLRHGVTFSNGDPFNAYQTWFYFYGIRYMIFNFSALGTSQVGLMSGLNPDLTVINASNVNFGPATISTFESGGLINPTSQELNIMENQAWPIYVTGPYQIVFHLQQPVPFFLNALASETGIIYDMQFILNHGGPPMYGTPQFGSYSTTLIPGTGPYEITNFTQNGYIKFQQYSGYWGRNLTTSQVSANPLIDPGHVKNVIIYYKPDDLARYTDLSNGVAQISMIESQDWPLISSNPSTYSYSTLPSSANIFFALSLNTVRYPTNITDVRLAIAHSINYTLLDQEVFHGQIHNFFGPMTPGFGSLYDVGNYGQYSYNVTLAKQYLQMANITNFPTLTWSMPSGFTAVTSVAQIVQSELATNLGINVKIETYTYSQYIAPYNQGYAYNLAHPNTTASMTIMGGQDFGELENTPVDDWITFATPLGFDVSWWTTPTVYPLLQAMVNGSSQAVVQQLANKTEAAFYNQAPYIWLGIPSLMVVDGSLAYKNSVISGFYIDPIWTGTTMGPIFNTVQFA